MQCTGKETGRSASDSFLKTRGFLVFKIRSDKSRKQCLGATQPHFRLLGDSPSPKIRTGFWPRILQMLFVWKEQHCWQASASSGKNCFSQFIKVNRAIEGCRKNRSTLLLLVEQCILSNNIAVIYQRHLNILLVCMIRFLGISDQMIPPKMCQSPTDSAKWTGYFK